MSLLDFFKYFSKIGYLIDFFTFPTRVIMRSHYKINFSPLKEESNSYHSADSLQTSLTLLLGWLPQLLIRYSTVFFFVVFFVKIRYWEVISCISEHFWFVKFSQLIPKTIFEMKIEQFLIYTNVIEPVK